MNILMLTRYDRLGASSRMRFVQYLPSLEAAGLQITSAPLFSDKYVRELQQNTRSLVDVLRAYTTRVLTLLDSRRFNLLWIEKEALPWIPVCLEHALRSSTVPYALDYDDAVFHNYDQHHSLLVRIGLANKHPALMRGAALVVAGNRYLAEFAESAGARQVVVIPTVVDLARYPIPAARKTVLTGLPTVGWIGQRATASFLTPLLPIFHQLIQENRAQFTAVGIDASALGLSMKSVPWTEDTEVSSISSFDVGIMPLPDEPFERGKCGYKLIQYMACGLPVVASPVGVNAQIVEHGRNGFLASSPAEWHQALETLLTDPAMRQRMGQAGRQKVEAHFSLKVTGSRLATLLKTAAST